MAGRRQARRPQLWRLYVIRTVDNCLYTGVTTDVRRRFAEHQSGGPRAARYLRAHRPAAIVFSRVVGTRSHALKVEYRFKQLTRKQKERVVAMGHIPGSGLTQGHTRRAGAGA